MTGAIILGLGRAVGETMAVTMVIGNRPEISLSLFDPSFTIASAIANEFTEATSEVYLNALVELGLVLFVITFIINALARLLVWSVTRGQGRAPVPRVAASGHGTTPESNGRALAGPPVSVQRSVIRPAAGSGPAAAPSGRRSCRPPCRACHRRLGLVFDAGGGRAVAH